MKIENILKKIKDDFEKAITTSNFEGRNYENGNKAKEALIRSQKLIGYIHEIVKEDLIKNGVNQSKIFPPLGSSKPELKLEGFLKFKYQDISVIGNNTSDLKKIKKEDKEKILTINIRSQLSSLQKNFDTLYERTYAEAMNLHLKNNKQVLGEVYLIPTHEYDDKAMVKNRVEFKNATNIDMYIDKFQTLNSRLDPEIDEYKYERICLLIADFRKNPPKVYSTEKELKDVGLIKSSGGITMRNLSYRGFVEDLLHIYSKRFNISNLK